MRVVSLFIVVIGCVTTATSEAVHPNYAVDESDALLTVPEMIKKHGYPVEVHPIMTSDGYILEMHRIPYGIAGPADKKPVVFLMHEFWSNSASWVIAGPAKGLAFLLADLGYDVWMGNARGNKYSKKHIELTPKETKFWDFSWHEIGVIDVPTMIDYILQRSEEEKMFYIGHGQGATVFYVMCSEKPEYNDKINAMFSLGPIAYTANVILILWKFIALYLHELEQIGKLIGVAEFRPSTSLFSQLCDENKIVHHDLCCKSFLFALFGCNLETLNMELATVLMGHMPDSSSAKQFIHFLQGINSGKFRQYDYGTLKNMIMYKSLKPPEYNLSNVTAPVAIHYSINDRVATERDILRLYYELGNPIGRFLVADERFSHMDFVFGNDIVNLVYSKVFALMERF